MSARAAVVAVGAVSPLGVGDAAFDVAAAGRPATVAIARDPELEALGFARPFCARAPASCFEGAATEDRAAVLLDVAVGALVADLARVRPGIRDERVGLAVGTSSGGMRTAERFFEARARGEEPPGRLVEGATYFAPFVRARDMLGEAGLRVAKSVQIVTACAASTWAIGVALAWLRRGTVDVAIAGGYDALGPFVAAGFEALRATSASMPAPFRVGRDGMALGEGAALVALTREGDERGARPRFFVSGFGASTDAVHVTAPDRTGGGLTRAAQAALSDAGVPSAEIALVSAHATATPYNDAMEARAIANAIPDAAPVVHPFKAQIGHALGAAGVLETLAIGDALAKGVAPAAAGAGELDEDARVRLSEVANVLAPPPAAALKLSAAFGGANAALVVEPPRARSGEPRRGGRLRRVYLKRHAAVREASAGAVAAASGGDADKIARMDALSLLAATAVAELGKDAVGGAGIIVGHALATIDINERFYARILAKGPTAAEPRLFPPTSPNVMPGQVAILFGLTGPSAACASGPGGALDPLAVAAELVACGAIDRMVACAVDVVGPAAAVVARALPCEVSPSDGAVAALLDADEAGAVAEIDLEAPYVAGGFGHGGLARFLRGLGPALP